MTKQLRLYLAPKKRTALQDGILQSGSAEELFTGWLNLPQSPKVDALTIMNKSSMANSKAIWLTITPELRRKIEIEALQIRCVNLQGSAIGKPNISIWVEAYLDMVAE